MNLPLHFLEHIKQQLPSDYEAFIASLASPSPTSVRLNPKKAKDIHWEAASAIPWHKEGYYLPQRPVFTLDPSFHAGSYYVQEASSMFLAQVVQQICDTSRPLRVLDLCAAPGGKSTLLASILSDDSFLLCNEVIKSRVSVLQQNLEKWGYPNVHISNHDSKEFKGLEQFFDLILVDAPCSGEGLFRKDPKAIQEWSLENVNLCSARQKRILSGVINLLKDGGHLIYSTCTYNDTENEENAAHLVEEFNLDTIPVHLKSEWGIHQKKYGIQFYPHQAKGEGFYLACFQKRNTASQFRNSILRHTSFSLRKLPKKQIPKVASYLNEPSKFDFFQKKNGQILAILKTQVQDCIILDQYLHRKGLGLVMGQFKGEDFIPSAALALSTAIASSLPQINLSSKQALLYLKKETLTLETSHLGWALATYKGLNLGWMKILKNRINNYYPKEWRIRMAIP